MAILQTTIAKIKMHDPIWMIPSAARLRERDIPFVIYSGFYKRDETHGDAVHVSKPASTDMRLAIA